jgi:oligopeptide/dipeptide ABC transporter ATP-binding protein
MRQRVMIAIAMAGDPPIVIFDEPTKALDVTVHAQIVELVKTRLQDERGTAIVWITHDLAVVAGIADRVALMYAGQIAEIADAAQFFREPAHPYARLLMASVPKLRQAARPEHIPGEPPSMIDPPEGCRFAARCPDRFAACARNPPPLPIGERRRVRCWLYDRERVA